ncbi:LPS-assembly protein LptD [Terriglobus roseus]|uniref:LPS-assembly protein n=1 Tax=Terriglobus roseus TaxID=392734 RepID=A0A1H4MKN3_9BACT|nr:LPS assembly protein LptD [Terriglobus roseus]SEB82922.1 LPS-assembly protein [Terriglobus roseus]
MALGVSACAQQVTTSAPVVHAGANAPVPGSGTTSAPPDLTHQDSASSLPDSPGADLYPVAVPVPEPASTKVTWESLSQKSSGDTVLLEGNVTITYGDYRVDADRVAYNQATGDLEATGHIVVTGASRSENIHASRATLNIKTETGKFYDVSGSVGVRMVSHATASPGNQAMGGVMGNTSQLSNVYTTANPFLFTGRMVVKNGPAEFDIYDGTVTSCQLPKPDWQLASAHFSVHDGEARATKTIFRLLNVPVFFLPYATHPTAEGERQSGFLIPVIGNSSSKGIVIGEQIYFAMGRSSELTVGAQYYSRRGWEQSATFRMRGRGLDFIQSHYSGLLDRGFYQNVTTTNANGTTTTANTYVNQGGEDATFSGRRDIGQHTRVAANVEYLSSYIYREAFTDNFNQAVSSDITSYAYGTHARNGYVASGEVDRYQGLKIVSTGEQIRIFHAPMLQGEVMERHVANTPFVWSATAQYAALKRTQGTPVAQTGFASDFTNRVDLHPKLSLPFALAGFHFRPTVGIRDTYYTHSRITSPLPGPTPTESGAGLNRLVTEAEMEVRMPVLERTFETGSFGKLLGREAKHTIEPELHYRYASGVDDFSRTLRFDDADVVANKNELEYGFTQRLFLRPTKTRACETGETPAETDGTCGGTRETIRWKLLQRHYFDESFGGYISLANPSGILVLNRRNVLDSTLDLSGVAFLTDRRSASPIVSQMKLSATDHIDIEWDMNYDLKANAMRQSNVFVEVHQNGFFAGLSHARLYAPGRFTSDTGSGTTATSLISDFSQLRVLMGYGNPAKPGLSIAGNVGLDLKLSQVQYATGQFSYNWNCCGFSAEYRKYELGSVRNENAYRFNFSLANIGTAGNLRRAERLF